MKELEGVAEELYKLLAEKESKVTHWNVIRKGVIDVIKYDIKDFKREAEALRIDDPFVKKNILANFREIAERIEARIKRIEFD